MRSTRSSLCYNQQAWRWDVLSNMLILDNTIPRTIEERRLTGWGENPAPDEPVDEKYEVAHIEVYNLTIGLHRLSKFKFAKYMPFLPYPYDNGQDQDEKH